ncbi:M50 family metallopeptidase [Candidatus Woesearchaeota archaeon]|nr:M50 family metallopeptidase [Candidatus Woesearchaeota archaeon]
MDKFAKKFSKSLKGIGYFAVLIGFLGMIVIAIALSFSTFNVLTKPGAPAGAGLVLPVKAKGVFYVPFEYWIISIFVIAVFHEFAHGIIARKYKMRLKSSGFAFVDISLKLLGILIIFFSILNKAKGNILNLFITFDFLNTSSPDFWITIGIILIIIPLFKKIKLPIIPAAFVEPDEKELKKRPPKQQLSVFAAGPFANILLAFIILGITTLIFIPLLNSMVRPDGVLVTGVMEGKSYPAEQAGITANEVITGIDGIKVKEVDDFSGILETKKPGDIIRLETNRSTYDITLAEDPENESKAYLGIYILEKTKIKESFVERYGRFTPPVIIWFIGLFYWLHVLNLGIGLFNLAPIGPLDGGRMLLVALQQFLKKDKAVKYWKTISIFFLALILINILFAFF